MSYNSQSVYAKYLAAELSSSSTSSTECDDCQENSGSSSRNCDCCPPGLVAVKGSDGTSAGCLTPEDAQTFLEATFQCNEGYVKLYKESPTPVFRGCVSENEFATLYATLNPVTP